MKRTIAWIGIALCTLALASTTLGRQAERPSRSDDSNREMQSPRAPSPERQTREEAQKLEQQISRLRAAHQDLIDALKAIHATAIKEKATGTAKQVEALISRRQAAFQESLRALEQQQQPLQRSIRERTGRPDSAGPRLRRAPEFELSSFDGRQAKLSGYQGQIVVLEWLDPACPYTRYHYETVQTMVKTAQKYRDKGVTWLAVNSSVKTTPEANREFAQKHKLPYPILDDRSGETARRYGARTTPHVFIMDKEGRIVYDGAIDNAPRDQDQPGAGQLNYVDKALAELTQGRPVSLPNTPPYGSPIRPGRP
ncbi:MAG: redoxin domain-containing protein [Planctomycetes bacterium]|nr:redoxin domain-containing protein [Planctomycetota bacterium]